MEEEEEETYQGSIGLGYSVKSEDTSMLCRYWICAVCRFVRWAALRVGGAW